MQKILSYLKKPWVIVILVLIIDQALKIWIKTHMIEGEEFNVIGSWFRIHFIENNGMAFGKEFGGEYGKIALSLFRICAVILIAIYIYRLSKKDAPWGVMLCLSLVLAGALGNILDSAFYGMIFDDSYGQIATLFPEGGGYSSFLHGKVVDMLYFPMVSGNFPSWFPVWGGETFLFFRPVFNIADSSIFIGIVCLITFNRKYFNQK